MIVGTLRILPAPDRRAEILKVFRSIQGPVLAQPGCAACHIYEEHGPEPAVVLVERWESDAALETHLRSDTYRRVLAAIELSGARPKSASTTCRPPKGSTGSNGLATRPARRPTVTRPSGPRFQQARASERTGTTTLETFTKETSNGSDEHDRPRDGR